MKAVAPFIFGLGVAISSVGFAQEAQDDKSRIESSWKVESSQDFGQDDPVIKGLVLDFKEGKLTAKRGEEAQVAGSYKLDSSTSPKSIDLTMGAVTFLGIYELKGDTLTICHGSRGDPRSTKFASEKGSANRVLTVLKREKK
jgi:uncharacterized protein (TIGR03067 family)